LLCVCVIQRTGSKPFFATQTHLKMKSALKVVLALLALGLIAGASIASAQDQTPPPPAQKGPGGGGRGGRGMDPATMLARLDEAVTLTADQKTKVTDIYKKMTDQMGALAPEDRRTKGQEIRTATNAEIRALLTPDQQKKFDAMPQGRGPGGGKGGPGGAPKAN
jgi:Spy/CpxP family protein refolding chaperone